ncbi:hypothetical protein [Pedobacter jejuensis]|uniref:Uncharacterized protein n=1 Tax=Pedobacter jejuensis TaxID=1268550 RepID=A0A3N0BS12_9SPHI|nr:hypothetical protein [Pedobacter jejuensis]RNL51811.1 hypothetical protein D7004_13780 [Pedobacter jejuensis]
MPVKLHLNVSLFLLFFISLNSEISPVVAQELIAHSAEEKKVLELVVALPEVKQRAREIKALSHGKVQITLMVSAAPDLSIPFYQINVNDNSPTYNNYYQFAVDPKTYKIYYFDAKANRQYSLEEWRKKRKSLKY